jgi:hypothetical protein
MGIQATIKVNQSLQGKLDKIEKIAEEAVKEKLQNIASDVVKFSPVDTGAYITSHSFKTNSSSGGRSRTSNNKPRGQNPSSFRQIAYAQLMADIAELDFKSLQKITLRNDSPHARIVEGEIQGTMRDSSVFEFDPRETGYFVYKKIRSIHK